MASDSLLKPPGAPSRPVSPSPRTARLSRKPWLNAVRRRSHLFVFGFSLVTFGIALRAFSQAMQWLDPIHFYSWLERPEPLVLGSVKWFPCRGEGYTDGAECGYVVVPLDYYDPEAGLAKIALGRYNATSGSRKGMIVLNPGGPGSPGMHMATEIGPYMQTLLGSDYDMVAFDPRGTGLSEPRVRCFDKPRMYQLFRGNTVLERGFDVGPDLNDPRTRERLLEQRREADALTQTQYEMCKESMGDQMKYMGTTSVARDVDFITTALEGPDALINFYGGSYGSVMGQYIVNMFPHRVGRIAIDAIAEATTWSTQPTHRSFRQSLTSTEETLKSFLNACVAAGPSGCPLMQTQHDTRFDLDARLERLLETLYKRPISAPHAKRPTMLTSGRARKFLFSALMRPRTWPSAAAALAAALAGDGAPILNAVIPDPKFVGDLQAEAVACNDAARSMPTEDEVVDEYLSVLAHVSRFGVAHPAAATAECSHWPFTPPERFAGPWNELLLNPILVLSNTADPVTPLSAARAVQHLLPHSSRLVVQNGPGHGTTALASLCTARVLRAFFANGTLPPLGAACEVDETPFPDARARARVDALAPHERAELVHLQIVGRAFDASRARGVAEVPAS